MLKTWAMYKPVDIGRDGVCPRVIAAEHLILVLSISVKCKVEMTATSHHNMSKLW